MMLREESLCVHPDDVRYSHLVGQTAINPLGLELPIKASLNVNISVGNGIQSVQSLTRVLDFGREPICEIRNTISKNGKPEQSSFSYFKCPKSGIILEPVVSESLFMTTQIGKNIPVSANDGSISIPGEELFFDFQFIRAASLYKKIEEAKGEVVSYGITPNFCRQARAIADGLSKDTTNFAEKCEKLSFLKMPSTEFPVLTDDEKSRQTVYTV